MRRQELAERAWQLLERLRGPSEKEPDPRRQRWLLAGAAVLFVVATVTAYLGLPERDDPIRWWLLVLVAVVGTPIVMAVNAWEYRVSGRLVDVRVPWRDAVKVTLVAGAANILPIPGSAIVRVADLRRRGVPTRRALASTLIVGVGWIGVAGIVGGSILLVGPVPWAGAVVILGGLVVAAIVALALRARLGGDEPRRRFGAVVVVESAAVAISTVRLLAVLYGLGHTVDPVEAAGLMLAGVIASATGVFPGGLGLREVLAAVVAPLVGLTPALGVFATAVSRLAEYTVLAPVALVVAARGDLPTGGGEPPPTEQAEELLDGAETEKARGE